MGCFHPIPAVRLENGDISFTIHRSHGLDMQIPCGQCIGCRIDRSKMWAIRCMHEASLYEDNCFITLTYADEYLPSDGSLDYTHFQKFMKRLRKRFPSHNIRFYMCGEYGDINRRPHYHALLFNFNFADRVRWKRTNSGEEIYRSAELESLWPFGHSSIGSVTLQSAGYVARYVMKKINGDRATDHYRVVSPDTGEIHELVPEFNRMSLKPGIAQAWFDKYYKDVYPEDAVILEGGKRQKPPKYYDKMYAKIDPFGYDDVQQQRELRANKLRTDNTDARLAVKEKVLIAKTKKLLREI